MKPTNAVQRSGRQKSRFAMAIAVTGIVLDMAGVLPPYFLFGVGVGWLLVCALDAVYD